MVGETDHIDKFQWTIVTMGSVFKLNACFNTLPNGWLMKKVETRFKKVDLESTLING